MGYHGEGLLVIGAAGYWLDLAGGEGCATWKRGAATGLAWVLRLWVGGEGN